MNNGVARKYERPYHSMTINREDVIRVTGDGNQSEAIALSWINIDDCKGMIRSSSVIRAAFAIYKSRVRCGCKSVCGGCGMVPIR